MNRSEHIVSHDITAIPEAYSSPVEAVVQELSTSSTAGLSEVEARRRARGVESEEIGTGGHGRLRQFIMTQVSSVVVWLLLVASFVAWLTENALEAYAILAVIFLNAMIGFAIEWKAGRALEALRKSTRTSARVRRDGNEMVIDASEVVVGDLVVLSAGDRVPADSRIVESVNLKSDESTLTGESVPVDKFSIEVASSTPLAERTSMLYLGSTTVSGHGTAIVTAVGADTEIGRIGHLVSQATFSQTPLEKRLTGLGKRLVFVVLGIAAAVLAAGVLRGDDFWLMTEVAISLSVAAVPEGLPAVTTLILALGVLRMARRNAIVRRLSAVETLGSSTVICSDKTGTLTENKMTVKEFRMAGGNRIAVGTEGVTVLDGVDADGTLKRLLQVGILCNEASDSQDPDGVETVVGDPTETAILGAARLFGLTPAEERAKYPIVLEKPFDAAAKYMLVVLERADKSRVAAIKGAPAVVLNACSSFEDAAGNKRRLDERSRERFLEINREMADRALRVLAFGEKQIESPSTAELDSLEGFNFLGFSGITDPIREGAVEAVADAHRAGIRVVMLTGDQLNTARAIAVELHLEKEAGLNAVHSSELAESDQTRVSELARKASVFARVTPEDKLRIVRALQDTGEIVAVTGDGVNDAPALKQADIGVAMGFRGTEVAKEAADIVLTDDNFSTIVEAIRGGRTIYANIIKFVHLMFSQNLSEVLVIFAAILAGLPLPLLPLQILWINLVTDVFPALALAVEPPSPNTMNRKPIPPEDAMLSKHFMFLIFWQGLLLASIALGAYLWALNSYGPGAHAQTVAMMAVVGVQFGHLFNCRSRSRSAFEGFFTNPYIFAAAGIVILLQVFAVFFPPLAKILNTVPPNTNDLLVVAITVLVPVIVVEITKLVGNRRKRPGN